MAHFEPPSRSHSRPHPRLRWLPLGLLVALAAGGCFALRPATAPLDTLTLAENVSADCLVVLLPGRGDSPQRYLENDFAAIAAGHGIDAEILAVDAHLGYYRNQSVADRLRDDVVRPARERGQRVWLSGISLGGLGSLLYMARNPGEIEGAVLLSPFLGKGRVLDEIEAAGSLAAWTPPEIDPATAAPPQGDEVWERLWAFLRQSLANPDAPPIYLAYGTNDRLSRSHQLLARELPADRVFEIEGGHDWGTWVPLWEELTKAGVPGCR